MKWFLIQIFLNCGHTHVVVGVQRVVLFEPGSCKHCEQKAGGRIITYPDKKETQKIAFTLVNQSSSTKKGGF